MDKTLLPLRLIRYVIVIFVFLMLLPFAAGAREITLNVLYTGAIDGELEPCGCSPKTDFGGLARTSGYILRNGAGLSPYVLIDAGNFSGKDSEQGRLKVEAAMKAFTTMKYDAVAFMKNEKSFPPDFFASLVRRHEVPFVSDASPFERSVTVSRGHLDVHISSGLDGPEEDKLNILVTDKSVADLKTAEGWAVIISSSGEIIDQPLKPDGPIIVSGYPKGKRLGILTLHVDEKGKVTNFKHRFEALGPDIQEDEMVRKVLDDYDTRVAALMKDTERLPAGTTYVGVSKCGECHQTYVESWEKTKHAKAFASLEKVGKAADPECIVCHTVGFGEKGGFYTIDTTPQLANVQCEECHGLDREHMNNFERPMRPVTESVCLKCHTKDNSPEFNYAVYLKKVIH
jgi:hypothetical protein